MKQEGRATGASEVYSAAVTHSNIKVLKQALVEDDASFKRDARVDAEQPVSYSVSDPAALGSQAVLAWRSEQSRGSFSLCNEDLVFDLHNGVMTAEKITQGIAGEMDSGSQPQKKLCIRKSSGVPLSQHSDKNEEAKAVSEAEDAMDPNAETAWAVGLNASGLADEEKGLLPNAAHEAQYAKVRNEILSSWRSDVSKFYSEKEAVSRISPVDKAYALAAWRFLHTLGFINIGVSFEIAGNMDRRSKETGTAVVVGAGCAGLAAARQLSMLGYQVVIVEGRDRPGGRVHTKRMQGPGIAAAADLGGSIITGIDGNPLAAVVKQLGINMLDIRTETPLFMSNGIEADTELDQLIEERHNVLLDECSRIRDGMPTSASDMSLGDKLEELWDQQVLPYLKDYEGNSEADVKTARKLFDWHLANLEFANASLVSTLSLRFWDQDDPNELLGAHTFIPGGNFRWVKELCKGLPVYYNTKVSKIRYGSSGVAVHADGRIFEADAAIVTVPLGVLKRNCIAFDPPLTERKKAAISRLGFGVLNKVIMLFPYAFWSGKVDMFGRVSDAVEDRGEGFLFYSYGTISGGALLIGLVAGEAALKYERYTAGEAAERVMSILRSIYGPRGVVVPAPLEVVCTNWGNDPMCYGAYSSMATGTAGGQDYDILGESLGGRVYFAGEATTNKYPATMHGAFYSGLQTAANVHATLTKAHGVDDFANLVSENGNGTSSSIGKSHAVGELSKATPQSEEIFELDEQLQVATQLQQLFEEPDLEFGCFAAVHAPCVERLGQRSLLRIYPGVQKHGPRRNMPIYMAVETQLALGIMDGFDNNARFALLSSLPDVALIDRSGLSPHALALLAEIVSSRGASGSAGQLNVQRPGLRNASRVAKHFPAVAAETTMIGHDRQMSKGFIIPRLRGGFIAEEKQLSKDLDSAY